MRQSFKMAIKNILSNKMRSFLTMLGIIIGVASVIILVGLVEGQMNYIRASFSDMGDQSASGTADQYTHQVGLPPGLICVLR